MHAAAAAATINSTAGAVGLAGRVAADALADHLNITDPSKLTLITFFVAAVFGALKRLFFMCRGKCFKRKRQDPPDLEVGFGVPGSPTESKSTQTSHVDLFSASSEAADEPPPPVPRGESGRRRRPVYLQVDTTRKKKDI